MNGKGTIDIQIAKGCHFDSPRNTFLNRHANDLPFFLQPSFELKSPAIDRLNSYFLDNGKLAEFSLANRTNFNKRHLIIKTSSLADKSELELVEEHRWLVTIPDVDIVIGQSHYLFSSDLTYSVLVYLEKPNALDNVIKSIIRICTLPLNADSQTAKNMENQVELYRHVQCIRSTKMVTSLKVSLSTAHVLCVLLNHENPKNKKVHVLKMHFHQEKELPTIISECNAAIDKYEIEVSPVKQIRLSPILTFIRDLSFNQFGDKLIVRCAKDFAVCPTSRGFRDKCEPLQGSNPFVTYNVSLRMEILVRDSHLQLGSCIEIYEIKVENVDKDSGNEDEKSPHCKQLSYRLIWSVTAAELGLSRVHVFQVQSFTQTLVFYNQMHTIHVLDPFKKKIINQLVVAGNDAALSSCTVNWSCQEVYVRFVDHSTAERFVHTKVFPLRSMSLTSNNLLDLSAMQVLKTVSVNELSELNLSSVFQSKLGYF